MNLYTDSDESYRTTQLNSGIPPPNEVYSPRLKNLKQRDNNKRKTLESNFLKANTIVDQPINKPKLKYREEVKQVKKMSYDVRLFRNVVFALVNNENVDLDKIFVEVKAEKTEKYTLYPGLFFDPSMQKYLMEYQVKLNTISKEKKHIIYKALFPCLNLLNFYFKFPSTLELINVEATLHFLSEMNQEFNFVELAHNPVSTTELLIEKSAKSNTKLNGLLINLNTKLFVTMDKIPIDDNKLSQHHLNVINFKEDLDNLLEQVDKIKQQKFKQGVQLVTADIPTKLEGRPEYQKFLLIRIILMMKLLSQDGTFVIKLPNTLSIFTHHIIWLMFMSFNKISLLQPPTINPVYAEKYLVCEKLNQGFKKQHIDKLIDMYNQLKNKEFYFINIFNKIIVDQSNRFKDYLHRHNTSALTRQIDSHKAIVKSTERENIQSETDIDSLKMFASLEFNLPYDPLA